MASTEFVEEYRLCLAEDLCVNSKPVIDNLTTLAAENKASSPLLADAICDRIFSCQAEDKLPALYLLDSICKNVGEPFVPLFAERLPEVFCCVWQAGNAVMHKKLLKLYFTWKAVFPPATLIKIDAAMRHLNKPPAAASPAGAADCRGTKAGATDAPVGHQLPGRTVEGAADGANGSTQAENEKNKKSSEVGQISDGMTVNVSSLVSLLLQTAAAGGNSKRETDSCVHEAMELTPAVVKVSKELGDIASCNMPLEWLRPFVASPVFVLLQAINWSVLWTLEYVILVTAVRKDKATLGIYEGAPYHSML